MEQRTSALQQRLMQRREFFKNSDSQSASPTPPPPYTPRGIIGSTGSASSNTSSLSSLTNPIPPATAPRSSIKDTHSVLSNHKDNLKTSNNDSSNHIDSHRKYSSDVSNVKPTVPAKPPVATRYSSSPSSSATHGSNVSHNLGSSVGQSNNTPSPKKTQQLDGYVGFANLPNQVYRKAVKKGFEFTLMVVGESGLGKSTLINSMFLTDVYSEEHPGPSKRIKKTVQVETNKVVLSECGVNLTLTIVDTPGFGDAVNNSDCWDSVITYVESQYEAFLNAETRVNRVALPDTRVHSCLYFIAPTGHGLKPLDVEFMKRLHDKVNIIPVIAKADTMVPEEIEHFKKQIMHQIQQSKIKIYEFPDCDGEEKEKKENVILKERVPFAVVGSNTVIETPEGKKIRGRKYPWGIVNIENMDHCDFMPLRNMLIRSHLHDLKEVTNIVHYENYRCKKLAGVSGGSVETIPNKNPLARIEEERREHQNKLAKMECEMEEVFERKVREKKQKLSDSEADLEVRHRESKEKLELQKNELEKQRAAFESEKSTWETLNGVTINDLKRLSLESLDGGKKKKGLSGVSFRMGR
uniref:Septin-type G domain-containing protein n=1 Tax=Lepeophtheirus salmonis TaxID=72036 RepID=A0A0K2U911_LEPSM